MVHPGNIRRTRRWPAPFLLVGGAVSAQTIDWDTVPMRTAYGSPDAGCMAVVHDEARARLVAFESSGLAGKARTWEGVGGAWTLRDTAVAPPPRAAFALAYDRTRRRTVLFGGSAAFQPQLQAMDDTWEWDGFAWRQLQPVARPQARCCHAMAFDPISQRVLVGGGRGGPLPLSDTWSFDGVQWTQVAPPLSGLVKAPMATDGNRAVVWSSGATTYEWNGLAWVVMTPATTPTPTNLSVALTPAVGGGVHLWQQAELWHWNGVAWRLVSAAATPPALPQGVALAMADDPSTGHTLLFGTARGTRAFDGTSWSTLATEPPLLPYFATQDTARDRLVVVTVDRRTFEWDGQAWREGATAPVQGGPLVFDERRARAVLLDPAPNEWDGSAWRATAPAAVPARLLGDATYDPLRQRIVASAASTSTGPPELWGWDGSVWVNLGAMPMTGRMAFDLARNRLVVVSQGSGQFAEWDGRTWTQAMLPTAAAGHFDSALGYDEARGRVVLQGGALLSAYPQRVATDATWEWDGIAWARRTTPHAPPARSGGALCFDRRRGRLLYVAHQRHENLNGGVYLATDVYALEGGAVSAVTALGGACGGSPPQLAAAQPRLDVGAWSLDLSASPGRPALFALGAAQAAASIGGCVLHPTLDLLLPTATDALGAATVSGLLPNLPALRGLVVFAQAAVFDGAGPLGGWSLTPGLRLQIR